MAAAGRLLGRRASIPHALRAARGRRDPSDAPAFATSHAPLFVPPRARGASYCANSSAQQPPWMSQGSSSLASHVPTEAPSTKHSHGDLEHDVWSLRPPQVDSHAHSVSLVGQRTLPQSNGSLHASYASCSASHAEGGPSGHSPGTVCACQQTEAPRCRTAPRTARCNRGGRRSRSLRARDQDRGTPACPSRPTACRCPSCCSRRSSRFLRLRRPSRLLHLRRPSPAPDPAPVVPVASDWARARFPLRTRPARPPPRSSKP